MNHMVWQSGRSPRMPRRPPPEKPGHRQIERAPEKQDGTLLAQKVVSERLEYPVRVRQRQETAVRIHGIVGAMHGVLLEWNRIRNLVRMRINVHRPVSYTHLT